MDAFPILQIRLELFWANALKALALVFISSYANCLAFSNN